MDIKVGSIVEEEVIDFTHEGKGVIKIDNFAVFVDGGLIGDRVEARIDKVRKNFGLGTVTNILEHSEDRVKHDFEIEESTGAIPLIEYKYSKQLEWKKDKIKRDLEKIGNIDQVKINDTLGMDEPFRYRNHVQIPVQTKDGKALIGFYELSSRDIVDMKKSVIQPEIGDKIINIIRDWIEEYNIPSYNKNTKKGVLRHIGIRTNKDNEAMVILVTGSKKLPEQDELIRRLTQEVEGIKSIYQNINMMKSPVVYGENYKRIYGKGKLIDSIGQYDFYISPNSFFQINRSQAEVLYNKAVEYLNPEKDDVIFDLYTGIGTIPIYLAGKVKYVYGIESVSEAVKDAKENKKLNNVENVEFIEARAEIILDRLVEQVPEGNKVILDPPRGGSEEEVLEAIIKMSPERIVYVSCNSTTLARDIKYLNNKGYKLKEVQPVDMFPHTMAAEAVALLVKE